MWRRNRQPAPESRSESSRGSFGAAPPARQGAPRTSDFTETSATQRGARELLSVGLDLRARQRLLLLVHSGRGANAAAQALYRAADLLHVVPACVDVVPSILSQEHTRQALAEQLRASDACVVVGGEGRPLAARIEAMLAHFVRATPVCALRVDPDALLADLAWPTATQRRLQDWANQKLRTGRTLTLRWHDAAPLSLSLQREAREHDTGSGHGARFVLPDGHVSVPATIGSGTLSAPTSVFLPDGSVAAHGVDSSYQFHGGALRAVAGPGGGAWLSSVMRQVPGMRLAAVGLGVRGEGCSAHERAGTRLTDVGCTLSVLDIRQRGVPINDAVFRGLTFCFNGPGLQVDIDGQPVLRDGAYTDGVMIEALLDRDLPRR